MNTLLALVLALALPAQPAITLPEDANMAPPPMLAAPQSGAPEAAQQVDVEIIAIKGAKKGNAEPVYDADLKGFDQVLETLSPNDEFQLINREKKTLPYGQPTPFAINGLYGAMLTAHGEVAAEEGGSRYDLEMQVDDLAGAQPVTALRARGEAAAREAIVLRGMRLGEDELIVFVVVSPEGQQGGGGDENSEAEQEQESESQEQQQQNQQQDASQEGEEEGEAPELDAPQEGEEEGQQDAQSAQQQEESPEGEADSGEPKNMETIKAILESLEQRDREEQKNAHQRRTDVKIRGDWW